MQKKLIALAIAGLASSTAFAQSNVTIYGVVDASVDSVDAGTTAAGGAAGTGARTTKISSNVSRIGFKGSEDLGDGLKAIFQLETAFNADGTATTNLNSRNTFIGLANDSWGQVLLGQYDTPYKTSTRSWDFFADHIADNRNIMGQAFASFDGRPANTIRYDSPDWNSLKIAGAYVAGAETATTSNLTKGNAWSLSGAYNFASAWTGIVAYEKHQFGSAATGTFAPTAALAFVPGSPAPVASDSEKAWKVGVGYKDGPIRANFYYEKADFDLASGKSARKAWTIDGGYTFAGNNEVKLAYTKANELDGTSSTGAKQWAIGVDHILSKRTKLYVEYVKLTNENNASYTLTGAGGNETGGVASLGKGSDPSAFQIGVKHTF